MSFLAFNSINFMLFLVLFLFCIFFNSKNSFKLLVLSELFWITFYALSLIIALVFDSTLILSLSFFFLMFSAAELSLGVSTFFAQKAALQSLSIESLPAPTSSYL